MYHPRSYVCVTRISPGLMINAGVLLASSRSLIFGGPVIAVELTLIVGPLSVRANETYSEAKCQFSNRNRAVLMNVQSLHTSYCTPKSAVFGTSSSLSPLVSEGRGLV